MQKSALTAILKDQLLKAKYHLTQTTFSILQLFDHVTDVTADCACVIATYFREKFFTSEFQVVYTYCTYAHKSHTCVQVSIQHRRCNSSLNNSHNPNTFMNVSFV